MNPNEINKQHATNKTYSYVKRGVSLSFTLDINDQLAKTDFIDLLKTAASELQQEIETKN